MYSPDSDDQLVQDLLDGNEQAFVWLVNTYHGPLLRLARNYIKQRGLAEEVVQETWEAILAGLPRFEGRSSLKTWMFRILSNRSKTRAVREARIPPMSAVGSDDDEHAVSPDRFERGHWATTGVPQPFGQSAEEMVLDQEVRQKIDEILETLPPRQAAVVTMRDIEGLSSQAVCNAMEISETNQRVLLHRGRSKVRAALEALFKEST